MIGKHFHVSLRVPMMLMMLAFWLSLPAADVEGEITITHPTGGEVLEGTVEVTWAAANTSSSLEIQLSEDNGSWTSIADNVNSTSGSFSWDTGSRTGDSYRLRIRDSGNSSDSAITGVFSIENADDDDDGSDPAAMAFLAVGTIIVIFLVVLSFGIGRRTRKEGRGEQEFVEDRKAEALRVLKESAGEGEVGEKGRGEAATGEGAGEHGEGDAGQAKADLKSKLRCPACKSILAISSDKRPITVQCPSCEKRMTIKG